VTRPILAVDLSPRRHPRAAKKDGAPTCAGLPLTWDWRRPVARSGEARCCHLLMPTSPRGTQRRYERVAPTSVGAISDIAGTVRKCRSWPISVIGRTTETRQRSPSRRNTVPGVPEKLRSCTLTDPLLNLIALISLVGGHDDGAAGRDWSNRRIFRCS